MSDRLLVFARYPTPGQAKTRLIPAMGAEGAAELQRRMTLHTLARAGVCPGAELEVCFTGGDETPMSLAFGPHRYVSQGEGDLGERMSRAVGRAFAEGVNRVVVIGTDCPAITTGLLRLAFDMLRSHDAVIGPARDGGYYLIGLSREATGGTGATGGSRPRLLDGVFGGIDWGTGLVLHQTLRTIRRAGLSVALLPMLDDIDTAADLPIWKRHNERLSVIVPALNEEREIGRTLERIALGGDVEVIVVDGGSTDRTVEIAEAMGARVVRSPRGRWRQMNAGVAAAGGGRLLFCHADTLLPRGYDRLVHETLSDESVALGAFNFAVEGEDPALRRLERFTRWRSRFLHLPYGDQGLFMRRETFERLGGFAAMEVMEDFDMVRRANRLGRVVTVDAEALTSGRMWERRGVVRTALTHQIMILGYYLGCSHRILHRWRVGLETTN